MTDDFNTQTQTLQKKSIDEGYEWARELIREVNYLAKDRPKMALAIAKLQVMSTHVLAVLVFNSFKASAAAGLQLSLQDLISQVTQNLNDEIQNAAEAYDRGETEAFPQGKKNEH